MFEDSTFESTGSIRTRSRRWMIATLALNASIVLSLILIPLVHPEGLPRAAIAFLMAVPPPPAAPPAPHPAARAVTSSNALPDPLAAPRQIPRDLVVLNSPEPAPSGPIGLLDSTSGVPGGVLNGFPAATAPRVVHPAPTAVRISSGVASSIVLEQSLPVYPAIAKAAGVEGTVVLAASISRSGSVINLRVVSGPAMLRQAALDAVKTWRYRPYLLNGGPVEVETTVNVVFTLSR